MIPTKVDRDILQSGEFEQHSMGVAEGSEAFIFNVLRNSLYTDKIGSPLREYIANALDEHVKANKIDVPVEVTFPTVFSNELRVRDYGFGLPDDKVIRFFSKYGASDKRESNNLIGAFGLGCKSAFAYTDSFTVVSYFDGTKTTFNLYIDETEVGKIAKLNAIPTDEPNGVEIIIPVRSQDVGTFVSRGLALMKYFKTIPKIKGVASVPDFTREASPAAGTGWRYFGDNRGSVLIQGQIGYPIDVSQIGTIAYYAADNATLAAGQIYEWEHSLLTSGLEIEVPIGDVEVTASREALQMTPKTIKAIRTRLATIREEIIDHVSEAFKTAGNLVEAKTAYYNFFQKGGNYGRSLHNAIGVVRWKGQELKDNVIHLKGSHKVMQYTKKYNGDIILTTHEKIQCSDDLNLYWDDTDRKIVNYKRRANTLLSAGAKQVTVVQTDDKKQFKTETGLDITKLPRYSKITPTAVVSTRAAGNGIDLSKRVKHKLKVFQLDWNKLTNANRVRGAKSDFWKVAEIEIDTQVYVPITRFEPNGLFGDSLDQMRKSLNNLHLLGIDVENTPIYGIKAGQDVGDMVRVDVWALEQTKNLPNLAAEVAMIKDYKTNDLFDFAVDVEKLPDGSLAKEYREQYAIAEKLMQGCTYYSTTASVNARLSLADIAQIDLPNLGKLIELSNTFKEHYPLIPLISEYNQKDHQGEIVDYVTLVDEAREAKASAVVMAAVA